MEWARGLRAQATSFRNDFRSYSKACERHEGSDLFHACQVMAVVEVQFRHH